MLRHVIRRKSSKIYINAEDEDQSSQNMEILDGFVSLVWLTEGIGLVGVGLILSWVFKYNNGLGVADPRSEFNWHPFFMSLGMIYLMGNALLAFRMLRDHSKKKLKLLHASIHTVVFILVATALYAVINYHNRMGFPNFYSIHSWIGLFTLSLFAMQFSLGFTAFLFPGLESSIRAFLLPYHVYFGNVILVMAICTSISGINESAIFTIKNYSALPSAGIILNLAGVSFVLFGILVIYLTTNIHYKRYPRAGDTTTSGVHS